MFHSGLALENFRLRTGMGFRGEASHSSHAQLVMHWPRPGSSVFLRRYRKEAVDGGENSPVQAGVLVLLLDDQQ